MTAKPVNNQQDTLTTGRPSLEEGVNVHLSRALEAESPDMKNYHIRSAQQLLVILECETD